MGNSQYVSFKKKADLLGITIRTLRRWVREGKIVPIEKPGNTEGKKYFYRRNWEKLYPYKRVRYGKSKTNH